MMNKYLYYFRVNLVEYKFFQPQEFFFCYFYISCSFPCSNKDMILKFTKKIQIISLVIISCISKVLRAPKYLTHTYR